MAYWSQSDLEDRLSAAVVRQILDDDDDGVADASAIVRLQADSDAYVEGFIRPVYSASLASIRAAPPSEVKRLSLDVAVAYAAMRHAEYVRRDGAELLLVVRKQLIDLRKGVTALNVDGAPEPSALNQAAAYSTNELDVDGAPDIFFADGTGDF